MFLAAIQIIRLTLKLKFKIRKGRAKRIFDFMGVLLGLRLFTLLSFTLLITNSRSLVCLCQYRDYFESHCYFNDNINA